LGWKIEFDPRLEKTLKKLGKQDQKEILNFLKNRVANLDNPRQLGKPLKGPYKGLWRYRFSKYRIICDIQENRLVVYVLTVGHRKNIYTRRVPS